MGLSTSHGAFNGSYHGFGEFRHWLGAQIGINLKEYEGYSESLHPKSLQKIKHTGLYHLFNHSDCEGYLTPDQCRTIATGLDAILQKAKPDKNFFSGYQVAKRLKKGCLLAYSKKQRLTF